MRRHDQRPFSCVAKKAWLRPSACAIARKVAVATAPGLVSRMEPSMERTR